MIDLKKNTTLSSICPVAISEMDCLKKVKLNVLFNFMQDLAYNSIKKIGYDYSCEGLAKKGLGWVITRYHVEFFDYPTNVNELKILTECRGVQKMTTYRDFEIFDNSTNKLLIKAVSSWFIIDMTKKSVIHIKQNFPEFPVFERRENDLSLNKLKALEIYNTEKQFEVRFDDLDLNNHVNNTVYLTWAIEALDLNFHKTHKMKFLDAYYKHEAKYGETVLSQVFFNEETLVSEHIIKNSSNNEELCLLNIQWENLY